MLARKRGHLPFSARGSQVRRRRGVLMLTARFRLLRRQVMLA
jgi:hypothetical protein